MAYSLNTDASTKKITLCSSGTFTGDVYHPSFTLSKAILLDDRLLHFCVLELVILKHPSFYDVRYMTGEVVVTVDDVDYKHQINQQQNLSYAFNPWLENLYVNPQTISVAVVDAILFNLLSFLKSLVQDAGGEIIFQFSGFANEDFIYNAPAYDDMTLL